MNSVYIDESGYTGIDLLNQDQPFQGASAIYISDSEAKELINGDFRHTPQIIRFSDRLVGNLCFEGRPPDFHWFDPNHNDGCGACQFHRGVRQTTL